MTDLEKAEKHFNAGNEKYRTGNYLEAIEDYDKAVKFDPNNANNFNNRGNAHNKVGNQPAAIEDFKKALELDPEFAPAHYNLGTIKYRSGEYTKAIDCLTSAIKYASEYAGSYYFRGCAYVQIGKNAEADLDFITLIKCTKDVPDEFDQYQMPLYKYLPIHQEQILSLINQEIYFSAYQHLNDPLECFFIHHEESEFGQSLKRQNITTRICALTYQPESKLMYSHYADAHQGLCVEYELNFESLSKEKLISYGNVSYGEKEMIENLKDFYLLKNTDWKYEEEYRLVRFDNEEFHDVKINSITFAYRCSEEYRKIIYTLCQHHPNICYWEMIQKDATNDLERLEITNAKKYSIDDKTLFKLMAKYKLESLYHYFKSSQE